MAEEMGEDRTEQPSPKRIQDAREKGQVPRSRELGGAAVMASSVAVLLLLGGSLADQTLAWMRGALRLPAEVLARDALDLPSMIGAAAGDALVIVAPLLLATVIAAIAAPMMLGGWNLSTQALVPDFSRLDPIKGVGRLFSLRGWVELAKTLAKFLLVGAIAAGVLWLSRGALVGLGVEPSQQGIAHGLSLFAHSLVWMVLALALIAAVDVPFQLWSYYRDLRMTREELKREMQESEGRPEVKGKIRRLQQEAARRRMMQDVPKADVVVVNPTHYAVALQYAEGKMRAPKVVAKGADLIAARIRELAREHRVPILEAPPLARALYRMADIGDEIPAPLYQAVAQVLTWVYQLRRHRAGPMPAAPTIVLPPGLPGTKP